MFLLWWSPVLRMDAKIFWEIQHPNSQNYHNISTCLQKLLATLLFFYFILFYFFNINKITSCIASCTFGVPLQTHLGSRIVKPGSTEEYLSECRRPTGAQPDLFSTVTWCPRDCPGPRRWRLAHSQCGSALLASSTNVTCLWDLLC